MIRRKSTCLILADNTGLFTFSPCRLGMFSMRFCDNSTRHSGTAWGKEPYTSTVQREQSRLLFWESSFEGSPPQRLSLVA